MILIARQYNLPSTRYIFSRSTGQNFDSGFKLDLAVLYDNPPPYSGSPVRNEALLIQSGSSVAPNKVSPYCPHTYPRCPGPGAGGRSATSQLLREVCPRPLSSTLPGQISRCHTSVITLGMTQDTSASILVLLHHNQTHQQGVIVINVSMYQLTANDSFNELLLTQNTPLWQL